MSKFQPRVGVMSRYAITTNLLDDNGNPVFKDSGVIFSPYVMTQHNSIVVPDMFVSDDGEFRSFHQNEIDKYEANQMIEKFDSLDIK